MLTSCPALFSTLFITVTGGNSSSCFNMGSCQKPLDFSNQSCVLGLHILYKSACEGNVFHLQDIVSYGWA